MRLTLVLVAAVSALAMRLPQTPARDQPRATIVGTASITGTVVNDDEARGPLRRATLRVERVGGGDIVATTTDDHGQFVIDALPAGRFVVTASKSGYVSLSYGATQSGGVPGRTITLTDGQLFSTGPIALARGAVIAGRLTDRNGRPVAESTVTATRFIVIDGERRPRITEGSSGSSVTNAHGEFRIFGLVPGEYVVHANASGFVSGEVETTTEELTWAMRPAGQAPRVPRPSRSALTLFPGTVDPSAAAVVLLGRGEERTGVDFALRYVPLSRVSGIVTEPGGQPAAGAMVRVALKQAGSFSGTPVISARTDPNGRFAVPNLPPGTYSLIARSGQANQSRVDQLVQAGLVPPPAPSRGGGAPGPVLWGKTEVTMSGADLPDVAIQLQPGLSVSGRVVATPSAAGTPVPDLARVRISLTGQSRDLALAGSGSTAPNADGTFRIDGVIPERYRLSVSVTQNTGSLSPWVVQSVMLGGQDVADTAIDLATDLSNLVVTLTDLQAQLSGMLTDSAGRPLPDLNVVVFSADRARWGAGASRIKSVRASDTGAYSVDGLPAGEYYICALTEIDRMLLFEPGFLEQLVPSAIKITVGIGEKKRQDLQAGR